MKSYPILWTWSWCWRFFSSTIESRSIYFPWFFLVELILKSAHDVFVCRDDFLFSTKIEFSKVFKDIQGVAKKNLRADLADFCRKTRWWFQIVFFSPLFGEDSHFDIYFSDGLVQPPTRRIFIRNHKLAIPQPCSQDAGLTKPTQLEGTIKSQPLGP